MGLFFSFWWRAMVAPTIPEAATISVDMSVAKPLTITVSDSTRLSGLLQNPPRARACYVLAHGAGAGMDHQFMDNVARGLATRGIATLRYQFPYMERGSKRPVPPALAQATVRAAEAAAQRLCPDVPLIAGGKSFGGRMSHKRRRKLRSRVCTDWPSSDFRCTRPASRRKTAPTHSRPTPPCRE
jgi:hypothetical protein